MSKAKYVKDAPPKERLVTVSARVPESLYNQFQNACKIAEENGKDVNITGVIHTAMREAVREVRNVVGIDKCNGQLDL